ncbi:MAG: hypothetical protein J0H82_26125 [Alphaproteobacteria bacterium]|jgi:hypothetical protein|nr:hypothetical protein [Alphaproteobacteria bacterium]
MTEPRNDLEAIGERMMQVIRETNARGLVEPDLRLVASWFWAIDAEMPNFILLKRRVGGDPTRAPLEMENGR